MKRTSKFLAISMAAMGIVLGVTHDAHAIIGRPLTPMSYAGVARRTVRRTAYVGAAAYGAAAYGAAAYAPPVYAAPPPQVVQTLPAGCQPGVACNGATYQPAYSGPNVVYVHE
jgi:hypothetical protein